MLTLLQTTQPAAGGGFTLDGVTALIVAIATLLAAVPGVLVAVLAFIRSAKAEVAAAVAQGAANTAQATGDQNSQRITNTSAHVTRVDGQQTELAQKVGEVAGTASALVAAGTLAPPQPPTQAAPRTTPEQGFSAWATPRTSSPAPPPKQL